MRPSVFVHDGAVADVTGLVLDTGALIAFEKNDRGVVALLARALANGMTLTVPAGVVGREAESLLEPAKRGCDKSPVAYAGVHRP